MDLDKDPEHLSIRLARKWALPLQYNSVQLGAAQKFGSVLVELKIWDILKEIRSKR